MFEGTVVSINIASKAEGPMQSVNEVRAIPGKGLEGDRYFFRQGTFYKPQPDREITLVEAEAIEAFRDDFKIDFDLSATRRNVVTRGVPLNHLAGTELWIRDVTARGCRLWERC